jgi:hypothetical protein
MPDRSRKRPLDLNESAASIVSDATGGEDKPLPADGGKDPAAVSLGRRGGLKVGKQEPRSCEPRNDQRSLRYPVEDVDAWVDEHADE